MSIRPTVTAAQKCGAACEAGKRHAVARLEPLALRGLPAAREACKRR